MARALNLSVRRRYRGARPSRRTVANPSRVSRTRMGLKMNMLSTTRMYRNSNINYTVAGWAGANDFRLNALPDFAEFQALFDFYKIWRVDVTFIPKYNTSDYSSGGSAYGLPTIYICEDRNSATVPATINELMSDSDCIARRFDRPIVKTCYPTLPMDGTGSNGIIDLSKRDMWVNTSYPNVIHYGIRWGLDMPVGLGDFKVDIVYKYYIKFKDVK